MQLKLLCREILMTARSNRALGMDFGLSGTTVGRYRMRLIEEGLDAAAIEDWDEQKLERRLNDGRHRNKKAFVEPDWAHIYTEMQRVGVTLRMLHEEYMEGLSTDGMSETEFRRRYSAYRRTRGLVMRMERIPGEAMYVDYSGKRPVVTDRETGRQTPVELFVAAMGASRKTFAMASYTQQIPDWIHANVCAVESYGVVPESIVPDNLKSAVTKRTRNGTVLLNQTYADFALHYGTAIRPARPRRPDDKATVEIAVRIAQRYILGRLRNRVFYSLEELNAAIAKAMAILNAKPMRGVGGKTRNQLFEELDRPAMMPLPSEAYIYGEWKLNVRVGQDYHVACEGRYYSVPHTLVGKTTNLKVMHAAIEVYHADRRVAVHPKVMVPGGCNTLPEHRPHNHRAFAESQPSEVLAWAERMGDAIHAFVIADTERRRSPILTVQLCQRLQAIVRQYGDDRVQAACARAIALNLVTIASLRSQLARGLDRLPGSADHVVNDDVPGTDHDNVRGADYYV